MHLDGHLELRTVNGGKLLQDLLTHPGEVPCIALWIDLVDTEEPPNA